MIISKSKFGKYCIAKVELGTENFQKLSSLPGYKKWVGREMMFDPTGANIDMIKKYWPDAEWSEETQPILNKYIKSLKEAQETLKYKEQELPSNDDFKFKTKPFEHQRRAFYMSRDKESFALLMEQGTGKTKVIIDNAAYLYAPNGVLRNWISNEIPAHMPDWCPYADTYYQSTNNEKKQKEKFDSVISSEGKLKIYTFNVEAFVSKKAVDLITKILISSNSMLVVDESSRIKTPGAKRTKLITKFGKYAKYRRILTGTPITKGPVDVFSQFKFLNQNILGYDSFYSFKARYCIMGGFENRQVVSYQNIDELTSKIEGHSYRVLKKDCLDLPPKIYQRYYVELSPKQKKLYSDLKKNFITELEGSSLSAPEAITRLLRLQQIICGWFPLEDKVEQIDDINPRLLALKE